MLLVRHTASGSDEKSGKIVWISEIGIAELISVKYYTIS